MAYQEYPKALHHPQYQPAVISGYKRNPDGSVNNDAPGKPAKFPPVHVNNKDQELQYASLGYLPHGISDPDAYIRATIGADAPQEYGFTEYPKWLYQCNDGQLKSELVNGADQEKKLGEGWFATPDLAVADDEAEEEDEDEADATPDQTSESPAEAQEQPREKRKYTRRAA